jgi:hypothetical protein
MDPISPFLETSGSADSVISGKHAITNGININTLANKVIFTSDEFMHFLEKGF